MEKKSESKEIILSGISVSEGYALGSICVYRTELDDILDYTLESAGVSQEMERYFSALNEVNLQFMAKQSRIARDLGSSHAEIYEAYRMILEDPFFQEEIPDSIRQLKKNSESIIRKKLHMLEKRFEHIKDEYLRERIYDIRGVSRRLIFNLMQNDNYCEFEPDSDNILLARELTPIDAIHFQHRRLKGIATEYGGKTSHAAILAHSLEIAALVGVKKLMKNLNGVTIAAVNGFEGRIILNPSEETKMVYRQRIMEWEAQRQRFQSVIAVPLPQIGNRDLKLMANINDETEIELAKKYHARGVGLFRTELQFIARERHLSETEQFELYKKILESFPDDDVVIRLLDMGGDKFLPFTDSHPELNPFLGWRSIRILLSEIDVLKVQLRALYRAAPFGRLKIMIPMISSLEDLLAVKQVIGEVRNELPHPGYDVPIGIMVEIPSAAIEIERILKECDFASIGTNDLVQYTLAVDRNNEKVASYYQPLNGAILNLIKMVVTAGKKQKKDISICGEMAGNPMYVPLLIALGVNNLSMHPAALPRVKNIVLNTSENIIEHLAKNYNKFDTSAELAAYLDANLKKIEINES